MLHGILHVHMDSIIQLTLSAPVYSRPLLAVNNWKDGTDYIHTYIYINRHNPSLNMVYPAFGCGHGNL